MKMEQKDNIRAIINNFIQEHGEQDCYLLNDVCRYFIDNCVEFNYFIDGSVNDEGCLARKTDKKHLLQLYVVFSNREQKLANVVTIKKCDIAEFINELLLPPRKKICDRKGEKFIYLNNIILSTEIDHVISIAYHRDNFSDSNYFKNYKYSNLLPCQTKNYDELMQEKKKYLFLDELIASLKLSRIIDDYLIVKESGILSYKIGENHFRTNIRMHAWQEVPNDYGPLIIKIRRIILKNSAREFVDELIKGEAVDRTLRLGGFIESEDNLSQDGNCMVLDNARVFGNAKVSGNAIIFHNAQVSGDAEISENVLIFDNAKVFGKSRAFGNAQVFGNAEVGNGFGSDYVKVYCDEQVFGNVKFYRTIPCYEMQTQFFGDYEFNDQNYNSAQCDTTMNFIRESIRSGGYSFIISSCKNRELGFIGLRGIDGDITAYIEDISDLNAIFGENRFLMNRNKSYLVERNVLSRYFPCGGEKTKKALRRCFDMLKIPYKRYKVIDKLLSNTDDYGRFDIFEEFFKFYNVFMEDKKLNPRKWQNNNSSFDDFVKNYIIRNNMENSPIKARLFTKLKDTYFNMEFLNLFREFFEIVWGHKEFISKEYISFKGLPCLCKDTTIFAPNGAVINCINHREGGCFLNESFKILRNAHVDVDGMSFKEYNMGADDRALLGRKNMIAYASREKDIFYWYNVNEKFALEGVAGCILRHKMMRGNIEFKDGVYMLSIAKGLQNTRNGRQI